MELIVSESSNLVKKKNLQEEEALTIYTYKDQLQEALTEGWFKLLNGSSYEIYSKAFDFFMKVGLYEGLFRPHIPNPVYDNAAKEIGQYFLQFSLEKGIYFKELFPGDFKLSREHDIGDKEFRVFYMTAFYNKKQLGVYKISFQHSHDHFEFPQAPILEVHGDGQVD